MLKLIDRYLFKEMTPPFFIGLLIYSFVLLMNQLLQLSELFIARGVSFGVTMKLLLYLVPAILAFTVPMSVLMGVLAGLSRMSSDSEITALKTLGVRPLRMLRPLLVFAFAGWVLTSVMTLYLAPHFNFKWIQTLTESVLNKEQLEFKPREFNESVSNMVLFVQDVTREKTWKGVFLYFTESTGEPRIVLAREGRLNVYPQPKRAVLELKDFVQHSTSPSEPDKYYRVTSSARIEEEISAENLSPSYTPEKRVREKNIHELVQGLRTIRRILPLLEEDSRDVERRKLKKDDPQRIENVAALNEAHNNRRSYLVEVQKKFALPFACWIFVFLGLSLGSSTRKGGRTSGFTLSIIIILLYYICITAGEKTAMDGRISPFIGMWAGNILFGLLGAFLFSLLAREVPFFSRFVRPPDLGDSADKKRAGRGFRWPRLSLPFPNILDRYMVRRYLFICTLVFLSLISISIIVTFFDRIGNLYEHNKPVSMLLGYIRFRIPEFIHFSLPVTALMGALITLGLFTKFNEITAMKACGISVYRAVMPLVLLAVIIGGLAFHIQENVLPYANKKAEEMWNKINDRPIQSYSYENRRWVADREGKRFYHYIYYDPKTSVFNQLSIFDVDKDGWTISRRIFAEKATLDGQTLRLEDGWLREFSGDMQVKFEKRKIMDETLPEGKDLFLREGKEPEQMTYGELRRYIRDIRGRGFDTVRFRVDLSSKISFPFVALIMTFLGIPFAFSMGKRGALVGIGVSLAISIVYWVAIGAFRSLGYVNVLSAFLAAWGPNLIFGLIGLYLLFRLRT